jgi:hypothetical protein
VLSGDHAEAQLEGEPSFPDVVSRRDRAAGNRRKTSGYPCLVECVFLRSRLRGRRSWGSPTTFPAPMTIPSDVRTRQVSGGK